jgi:predicted DCC family thiol-disulfide oxidoreductase YuxK
MLDKKIIVFDGVCILCNSFVQFIIKKDRAQQFYFTTAQSDFVKEKVHSSQLEVNPLDSVIYLKNGKALTESSAVLSILSDLGGLWKLLSIFKLIPSFIRNAAYRFCAKRRYRVFGILDSCILPSSDWENRFLP